jgi:two-component system cell cycle sensor histidine kinase/response regulator CckA
MSTGTPEAPAAGAQTVLLVDDDEVIRDLLTEVFALTDLQFECMVSGADLLTRLASKLPAPDVLLLDLSLPDAMGEHLLNKVCKRWKQTTCILCTGHIGEDLEAHFEGRAAAILRKPFYPRQLLALFGINLRGKS